MTTIRICIALLFLSTACFADKAKAKTLFEGAVQRYNLGEYNGALGWFKSAYAEFPDPIFLFNIAQCFRQLGEKGQALTIYRSYLRESPDAPNAGDVRRLISLLEQDLVREQQHRSQAPAGTLTPAAPAIAPAVPPASWRPRRRSSSGWFIGGAGLALAAIGAGLVGGAVSTEGDARTASLLDEQRALQGRANHLEVSGWVMLGLGGAGVVAGIGVLGAHVAEVR